MTEPNRKANSELVELLQTLINSIQGSQEHNRKIFENHAEMIKADRDAIAGLAQLVSQQNAAYNIQREVVAKIFEQLNHPAGYEGPEEPSVN